MINYIDLPGKSLEAKSGFLSDYTAEEIAVLKEKWEAEENRLENADICGFDSAENVVSPAFKRSVDVSAGQLESLQNDAKKYRYNQQLALEREVEKRSANISTVEIYADMIKVKTLTKSAVKGGGERQECKGFSDNSRRRLIQKMAQWNLNDKYAYFITLTYPRLYVADWKIWKRDLDVLFKRLERKYPELVGSCWRVEHQKRGAPHYHLIAVSSEACKNLTVFRLQIAEMWADIVADGYMMAGGDMAEYAPEKEKHLRAGTGIEAVQGRRQLMAYVSKYLAKTDQGNGPSEWGRNWGFRNLNGQLDFSPVEVIEIDYCEAVQLKRYIRRWLRSRGRVRYAGMLNMRVSYSVLGLGADSENGRVVYKLLGGIRQGLFASHISPGTPLELGCSGVTFTERLQMGVYGARKSLSEGGKVITPLGNATVSQVKYCEIVGRLRVAVYLDVPQANGVRLAVFDVWQVKAVGKAEQAALWQ
jgi:hypothetical protein